MRKVAGHGYGVLTKTPELVREEIEGMMAEAVAAAKTAAPPVLPDHFHVEVTYVHHYDAYGCSHYPGAASSLPPPWPLMPMITVMCCAFSTL